MKNRKLVTLTHVTELMEQVTRMEQIRVLLRKGYKDHKS